MASREQPNQAVDPVGSLTTSNATPSYDLVCVGFGAAQLATAIANREAKKPLKVLFIERKQSFPWQTGSHLSRTRMENPFIYDLATIRNPRSAFTYVSYLLARKRIVEFANSDRLNPLREEFEDYLKWCAEQFKEQVRYGSEVVEVVPETDANTGRAWRVTVRDQAGNLSVMRARNVITPSPTSDSVSKSKPLATVDFLSGQRIISMDDYLSRRNELRGVNEPRLNIAVVGSGQRTVEILDDLLSCPRLGNITVVTEDESLAPLRILNEEEPPQPRLCSIWAKPSCSQKGSVTEATELIQTVYMRAYEKKVASKREYGLRVVIGQDAAEPCSTSNFIIKDTVASPLSSHELLQNLDTLVLGCRSKGDSLEEVQFKRGSVADGCRLFLMSAHSDSGRSLAKDVAVTAGQVVNALSSMGDGRQDGTIIQARM